MEHINNPRAEEEVVVEGTEGTGKKRKEINHRHDSTDFEIMEQLSQSGKPGFVSLDASNPPLKTEPKPEDEKKK